jgi:hypothetical protein
VEDFTNPSPNWQPYLNYWRLKPEQWYVQGGAMKHTYWYGAESHSHGAHDALMMYHDTDAYDWTDYHFEVRTKFDDGIFQGIWFRGKYIPSQYAGFHVEGYYLAWRINKDTESIKVSRIKAEGESTIPYHFANPVAFASADYRFSRGVWYTIAVDVVGDHIEVYVNGDKVIDAYDSTYSSGTVGFYSYKMVDASWDDVLVTPIR